MEQNEEEKQEEVEMVTEARKQLRDLFSDANKGPWSISYPSPPPPTPTVTPTSTPKQQNRPPPSAKKYRVVPLSVLLKSGSTVIPTAVDAIGESVGRLFFDGRTTFLHNASFWTTFFHSLLIEMSVGLVVRPGREAEVRHELVSPLLQRVAHCVSSMAAPAGWDGGIVFSSIFNVEKNTEERRHTPGQKPRVDYTLCGHASGDLFYRIPFEVKKAMSLDDMAQLAQYTGS